MLLSMSLSMHFYICATIAAAGAIACLFIARQEISGTQVEALTETFSTLIGAFYEARRAKSSPRNQLGYSSPPRAGAPARGAKTGTKRLSSSTSWRSKRTSTGRPT